MLRSRYSVGRLICASCKWTTDNVGLALLNELIDVLLDIRYPQHATGLRSLDNFRNQLRVRHALRALHDADDGGLRLELAIGGDTFVRLLVLLLGLFELYGVDFDAIFLILERLVDREGIIYVDVFAFGVFGQRT